MANMEQEKEKNEETFAKKVVQTALEAERSAGSRYCTTHGC